MGKTEDLNILVVDDQCGMRETLLDILQEQGYSVESAGDGYLAIQRAEQKFFDIILMDIIMPGINGVDTIKEIKKNNKQTEFILMTAYSAESLIEEALGYGIYKCMYKPFPPDEIITLLEEIREKKRRSKE